MENGKLILDACCGSRMFWFDKKNPLALFADIRDEEYILCDGRNLKVHPDIVSDFTDMPFLDKSLCRKVRGKHTANGYRCFFEDSNDWYNLIKQDYE